MNDLIVKRNASPRQESARSEGSTRSIDPRFAEAMKGTKSVGERVKALRLASGLKQGELASPLDGGAELTLMSSTGA
jgi:ribosome-binding protein aMBF1 (putative translation factor)